jgi:hypothetical protein
MPLNQDGRWTGATLFNIAPTTIGDGQGRTMPDARGLFVLHAALLHTGEVLCFAGHVEGAMYAPLCYLFNPSTPGALMPAINFPAGTDLFCCHYVQVPDGKLLAMGGSQHDSHDPITPTTIHYRGSNGARTIALFDPDLRRWTASQPDGLQQGRWYPTAVTLPDGRVAVFSGRRELTEAGRLPAGVPPHGIADMVEILTGPSWASVAMADHEVARPFPRLPIYPGMHLAKDGRIYFTHTNWGQQISDPNTVSIEISSNTGIWQDHGALSPERRREEGMSVLLPPAQDGKILVIGGSKACRDAPGNISVFELPPGAPAFPRLPTGPNAFHHIFHADDGRQADILDTTTRTWTSVGPMNFPRINGHCVILPDATVFICGGHDNYKWQDEAQRAYAAPVRGTVRSLIAEIFDPTRPAGSQFRTVPVAERGNAGMKMTDPRMYHSVALLLPNGRVFTAGGADPNHEEPPPSGGAWVSPNEANFRPGWLESRRYEEGMALNTKSFELYEPPYFFKGPRPTIPVDGIRRDGVAVTQLEYGQAFTITTPQAADIDKVALMRPGAPTHHTDTEQRYVRLDFTPAPGQLNVTNVNDAKLAPPGYYMLWIVDTTRRPCEEARWVQITARRSTCVVATASYGSPDHPQVAQLQDLREELRSTTRAGRWFMAAVTRVYEAVSPPLAARMHEDPALREAVRDEAVRPIVATIAASERVARRFASRPVQHAAMLGMFGLEAIAGALLAPVVAARVLLRVGLRRKPPAPPVEGKG